MRKMKIFDYGYGQTMDKEQTSYEVATVTSKVLKDNFR